VRFLLDQNLSPRLCNSLRDLCEEAVHVRDVELEKATDATVWKFAGENGYIIVTKDSDFNQLSLLFGHPPKIIWIGLGNCTTRDIEFVLQARRSDLIAFSEDPEASILNLGPNVHPAE
jgi:predicted nuclease of predicted toxin-antitoxin system